MGIQSAGELVSETSQLRILHSAEEDNLSPFDSKIACLCQRVKINNNKHVRVVCMHVCMYVCMSPRRTSKLTHTGVEIDTCAFQTGCQLSSAALGMSLGLCVLTQFQWHEANVPDNWQLAVLPQSGRREFNPHRIHDNLSVLLWVYMRFPVPEHQN